MFNRLHTPALLHLSLITFAVFWLTVVANGATWPHLNENTAFANDLDLMSTAASHASLRLSPGEVRVGYQLTGLSNKTGKKGSVQAIHFQLQPSNDYALHLVMSRWPDNRGVVAGTHMGLSYYWKTKGKTDYSLGLDWSRIQNAATFSQRDIFILGGAQRKVSNWLFQVHAGPALRHTYAASSLGLDLEDRTDWYLQVVAQRHWKSGFDTAITIPVSSRGVVLQLQAGWRWSLKPEGGQE